MASKNESVRILLVGDEGVGKTCLVLKHVRDVFPGPDSCIPKVAEQFCSVLPYQGRNITTVIWDMSERDGAEDFDKLRVGSYCVADAVILCFSVVSRSSFENVKTIWVPELKKHARNVPVILVGMKADLRSIGGTQEHNSENGDFSVSFDEGRKLSEEINASGFTECSSLTGNGVKSIFEKALLASMKTRNIGCAVI